MTTNTDRDALAFRLFLNESGQDAAFLANIWANHPDGHPVKVLYLDRADEVLGWMRENRYEKRALCPQPCGHLSQHDAREGRTCAEHPCTCAEREPVVVDDAMVERAAAAIFALNPVPYSWTRWDERIAMERKGDKSWSGPVKRCRDHARAALTAALTPDGQEAGQ